MGKDIRELLEGIAYDILINEADIYGGDADIRGIIRSVSDSELVALVTEGRL